MTRHSANGDDVFFTVGQVSLMAGLGWLGAGVFLFFLGAAAFALLGLFSVAFGLGSLALTAFVLWDRFSEFFQAAPETFVFSPCRLR